LGTSVLITVALAIAFSLFRPYNSLVYAPKLKVADDKHAPPALGKGIFTWVKPVLVTKEQDYITLIGLDGAIFLRVVQMLRNMFIIIAAVGCAILIPLNISQSKPPSGTDVLFTDKITPRYTYGKSIWGIVVCAYFINMTVCFFLWWNYRAVLRLRRQYYDSTEYQNSLHARTLMVCEDPLYYCLAPLNRIRLQISPRITDQTRASGV
jgi:hypothetical protein